MRVNISAALLDLGRVVGRIAELVEWEKLVQQERPSPFPSAVQPADRLREDILALYAWFVSLDTSIHEVLSNPDLRVSEDQRRRWQRRLRELEERVSDRRGVEST